MPVEVDPVELKRFLKLLLFRVLVLGAHYIAVMDALASVATYAQILNPSSGGGGGGAGITSSGMFNVTNITTTTTTTPIPSLLETTKPKVIKRPTKIGVCNMKKKLPQEGLDSLMLNFSMSFFLLLGFYGIATINFLVKLVVNLRMCICPVEGEPDKLGNPQPTIWHKLRGITFNLATFPCDTAIMSCIVGLYAVKRGGSGLGCWECYMTSTCTSEEKLDEILFMSSLSLNLNFLLVLGIVFYKGFIAYFRSTDPEKCNCHCVAPRCVTGCFVSLVVTSVVMMPPFLVMKTKYYDLKDVEPGFVAEIFDKMMLVGIVIWGVIGIGVCIVVPLKMILMRGDGKKK